MVLMTVKKRDFIFPINRWNRVGIMGDKNVNQSDMNPKAKIGLTGATGLSEERKIFLSL